MKPDDVCFLPEDPAFDAQIEAINEEAFGPGRYAKAAYRIREGGPHDRALSFVALKDREVIASVRLTHVVAGEGRGLLLGPLTVKPSFKNKGYGKRLVTISLDAARVAGQAAVILVGDEPYYGPLGFVRMKSGQITLPRPVDTSRLLIHEIEPGAAARFSGALDHVNRSR